MVYARIRPCLNRPIASCPTARFDVLERVFHDTSRRTFTLTGKKIDAINICSYNYLGFAETSGACADAAIDAIRRYGIGPCSSRSEVGTLTVVKELEHLVAEFVQKPAAMVFGMGFATNAANIPALAGENSLIISDELNHASLVLGIRLSGAKIVPFKHNDMEDLEKILRRAVVYGNPKTNRSYDRILICVEGIYSMEGSVVPLTKAIELKKKYKAYLYLDEAHSIGCMGKTGRGVSEYWDVDTSDIDIMMGTFTKSFGSCGGYIAGTKDIIDHLRRHSHNDAYTTSMSAPIAAQALESMRIVMGRDGTDDGERRLRRLAANTRYLRRRLMELGYIVYGNYDSPVIPVIFFQPSKLLYISNVLLERNIAVVVAGYPATPLIKPRVRFCMSSALTKDLLDEIIDALDEIGDRILLKQSRRKEIHLP